MSASLNLVCTLHIKTFHQFQLFSRNLSDTGVQERSRSLRSPSSTSLRSVHHRLSTQGISTPPQIPISFTLDLALSLPLLQPLSLHLSSSLNISPCLFLPLCPSLYLPLPLDAICRVWGLRGRGKQKGRPCVCLCVWQSFSLPGGAIPVASCILPCSEDVSSPHKGRMLLRRYTL